MPQQAILGREWMQKHKSSIDWETNTDSVTNNGCQMSLPLVEPNKKPLIALTSALIPPSKSERQIYLISTHNKEVSTSRAPQIQSLVSTLPRLKVKFSSNRLTKNILHGQPNQTINTNGWYGSQRTYYWHKITTMITKHYGSPKGNTLTHFIRSQLHTPTCMHNTGKNHGQIASQNPTQNCIENPSMAILQNLLQHTRM